MQVRRVPPGPFLPRKAPSMLGALEKFFFVWSPIGSKVEKTNDKKAHVEGLIGIIEMAF